jgi:hypothetical protein
MARILRNKIAFHYDTRYALDAMMKLGRSRAAFRRAGAPATLINVYLLRYERDCAWRVVVIADAYSVAHARMVVAGLGPGRFVDGRRVSRASVERLPPDAVGRVLTLADLTTLAEGKKKPPAPSVRRRGAGAASG